MPASSDPQSSDFDRVLAVFDEIKTTVGRKLNRRNVDNFISVTRLVAINDHAIVVLGLPTKFARDWCDQKYRQRWIDALSEWIIVPEGQKLDVRFIIVKPDPSGGDPAAVPPPPALPAVRTASTGQNPDAPPVSAAGATTGDQSAEASMPSEGGDPLDEMRSELQARSLEALQASERFWRRSGECHEFFSYNLNLMWPWRVTPATDKDGNPRTPTNRWFGYNGQIVQAVEGGVDANGNPLGIPGHVFPFILTIALITEWKYPLDKGTNVAQRVVCLGDTLVQVVRYLGYKCPRGRAKEERFLERFFQYCGTSHRLMMYRNKDDAYQAYLEMLKTGQPPSLDNLRKRDETTKIISDARIWDKAEISRDPATRRPFGVFELNEEFVKRFANRHTIPLHPAVVAKLMGNPQDIALYTWWTGFNYDLWKDKQNRLNGRKRRSDKIGVADLLDQIGSCRKKENKRPTTMIGLPPHRRDPLNPDKPSGSLERVRKAINEVAAALGRPECFMVYEVDRFDHAAFVKFTPAVPLRYPLK